ncbi:MAG: 50S ribosomal protein L17 [Spirochaetales bacterium]|nr:50S ribosomal protein L17 [Spirochaetales bacterium]
MKHKIGFNTLGRRSAHRKALHRNMVISLFRHERIKTTKAKAKEIRKTAEKLVTRAKEDSVHNRRIAARRIHDKAVLAKLFTVLGPRYQSRPGGYTRILKLGYREGDGSEIVILELVDRKIREKIKAKKEKKTEEKKPAEGK